MDAGRAYCQDDRALGGVTVERLAKLLEEVGRLGSEDGTAAAAAGAAAAPNRAAAAAARPAALSSAYSSPVAVASVAPASVAASEAASASAAATVSSASSAAASSAASSPRVRHASRITLPGASVGTKLVNVFLLKQIPWDMNLLELTAAIRDYARSKGTDLTKEVVPAWDKDMVYAELQDKVKVEPGDCVHVRGTRVAMEPASNPSVDTVPPSRVVHVRCIALAPSHDYAADDDGCDGGAYRRIWERKGRRVTPQGARWMADVLGAEWDELAIPANNVKATRLSPGARGADRCRRMYTHVLVQTRETLTPEQLWSIDGRAIDIFGLHLVMRVGYARTPSLRSQGAEDQRLTLYTRDELAGDLPAAAGSSVATNDDSSNSSVCSLPLCGSVHAAHTFGSFNDVLSKSQVPTRSRRSKNKRRGSPEDSLPTTPESVCEMLPPLEDF